MNWNRASLAKWTHVSGRSVDIMAHAFRLPALKKTLELIGLEFEVMISNVGAVVEAEARAQAKHTKMDWITYHDYDEVSSIVFEV